MNREKRKKFNVELKIQPAFQTLERSKEIIHCP